ncbi:hypothetical protein LENED_006630 [Lentinula edodes]|uniref:Uncharacterized protein n=1 Tax=Lentinula edodes TaxID=5353 RepID=A0A1Q3EC79_LENED|nr:hypothetical protein LENED_006630 [Lentinula edodes]
MGLMSSFKFYPRKAETALQTKNVASDSHPSVFQPPIQLSNPQYSNPSEQVHTDARLRVCANAQCSSAFLQWKNITAR